MTPFRVGAVADLSGNLWMTPSALLSKGIVLVDNDLVRDAVAHGWKVGVRDVEPGKTTLSR